jgi:hypothetical protein
MNRARQSRRGSGTPHLTIAQLLKWADEFHRRAGRWPNLNSGRIAGSFGENWRKVDSALRIGLRGLEGKSSLALFLAERRSARTLATLPRFTIKQILTWADSHFARTGTWPKSASGFISEAHKENWNMVDTALRLGLRGLPGLSSLAQLLAKRRGVRNLQGLPRITEQMILDWADRSHARTGFWPTSKLGRIPEAKDGTTWLAVEAALRYGRRGLPGGSSLAQLLAAHRGVRNPKQLPPLSVRQVLAWGRAYYRCEGHWPSYDAGPVREAPDVTWRAIATSLRDGLRGLPGGISLARLLREQGLGKHLTNRSLAGRVE